MIDTFKRETERNWIVSVHSDLGLIANGSDSGLIVFNLERERIPFSAQGNNLFYAHKRVLKH